jgi:PEP-CTERM motif
MFKQRTCVATLVAAGLLSYASVSDADSILVGTLGVSENCAPFGCPAVFGLETYQQVYSSGVFDGPITISSITFFDTFAGGTHGNAVDHGTYTISFSTTSAAVGGLSETFADNVGADSQEFFSGDLGGPMGGPSFTVSGTPFEYDPALGNLLLQVDIDGASSPQPHTFHDSNSNNGLFSRMLAHSDGLIVVDTTGLVTEFNRPVPEPATILLLGIGLAGFLGCSWRRA